MPKSKDYQSVINKVKNRPSVEEKKQVTETNLSISKESTKKSVRKASKANKENIVESKYL